MTDIVERLRRYSNPSENGSASWQEMIANSADAADEIERLREALKEIASIDYRGPMPEGVLLARKALGEKK